MTIKDQILNGLFALVVLLVCPSQITSKRDTSEIDKKSPGKHTTSEVTKVDSIGLLTDSRDSLMKVNIKSLERTDRKLDQIPKLVDKIILSQRRINHLAVDQIQLKTPLVVIPFPEVKQDSIVKKKRIEVKFLSFLNL